MRARSITPEPHNAYRLGVPDAGTWREIFNSDAKEYVGSGVGNGGAAVAENFFYQVHYHSLLITLPPLGVAVFESPGPALGVTA